MRDGGVIVSVADLTTDPSLAEIVTDDSTDTARDVILKVPLDIPASTLTVAGTTAFVELEVRPIVSPAVGAIPSRVTVPIDVPPPATRLGETETEVSAAGLIAKDAVLVDRLKVPEIVAMVLAPVADVVITNVADEAPLGTFTIGGTTAIFVDDLSEIEMPLVGAAPLTYSVPMAWFPPLTADGTIDIDSSAAGFKVNVAVFVTTPCEAVMVTGMELATVAVFIANDADDNPAAMVTALGTVTAAFPAASETTNPPKGAGALIVMVPTEFAPPITTFGVKDKAVKAGGVTVKVAVT